MFVIFVITLAMIAALGQPATAQLLPPPPPAPIVPVIVPVKLDPILLQRAFLSGTSLVVVRAINAESVGAVATLIQQLGGTVGRPLAIINGWAARIPNPALSGLSASSVVQHISLDRLVLSADERTGATIGSTAVRQQFGYDGDRKSTRLNPSHVS